MSDAIEAGAMHAVYERLTRLEERGTARDERIARMEQTLVRLATQMEAVGQDVRDAKTGRCALMSAWRGRRPSSSASKRRLRVEPHRRHTCRKLALGCCATRSSLSAAC